jgi:hypothetical protein
MIRPLLAVAALAALALAPPAAHAGYAVRLSQSGFADLVIADNSALDSDPNPGEISFSGMYGNFRLSILGSVSNTPGTPTSGLLTIGVNTVRNLDLAAGHMLTVTASATDYSRPPPPVKLFSGFAGTFGVMNPPTDAQSFQSFFNPDNGLFSMTGAGTGVQSATRGADGLSFDREAVSALDNYTGLYSLTSVLTYTAAANDVDLDFSMGTNSRTEVLPSPLPVPPSALVMAFAVPLLGLGRWLRRRLALRELALG